MTLDHPFVAGPPDDRDPAVRYERDTPRVHVAAGPRGSRDKIRTVYIDQMAISLVAAD